MNEEEIFCLVEKFLFIAREKGYLDVDFEKLVNGQLVITDKQKMEIIREMEE